MLINIGDKPLKEITDEHVFQIAIIEGCINSLRFWNKPLISGFDNTTFSDTVVVEYVSYRKEDNLKGVDYKFFFNHVDLSFHYLREFDGDIVKRIGYKLKIETISFLIEKGYFLPIQPHSKATENIQQDFIGEAQKQVDILGSSSLKGKISDGYHTFEELYEFRMIYNAVLFNEWAADADKLGFFNLPRYDVHKSWKHHDGELCFGGGWFIVVAMLPTGQITNHYEAKHWDLFQIPEAEAAKYPFDGHTPADTLTRLKNLQIKQDDEIN